MRIFLILFLFAAQLSAQQITFKKGIVIDSLKVSDTLNESYALYLPSGFDGRTALPVIFVLDGQGRGRSAARLFQTTAEEQGYILIASNDILPSKTLEENLKSAVNLVQEASKVLPLDFQSISFAGFAEGAHVASALPLIFNEVHGVIYVGDQLFNFNQLQKRKPFTAVGIVGNQQMNLGTMEMIELQFKAIGYPGLLYVFDGGLEWPAPAVISSAVGSLTLESIKARTRPLNEPLVTQLYQQDLERADNLKNTGHYLMAQSFLDRLIGKYEGVIPSGEVKEKLKQLRQTDGYKEQRIQSQEVQEKEERLWNDFVFYFNEDIATANFENLGWWNFQNSELIKLTEGTNKAESAMAFRLLGLLNELSQSKIAEVENERVSMESRLLTYMLATVFDQNDYESYKKVISLSTMENDFATALFYLEEMLKNGYKDMDALYEIEGTLGLKLSKEYNWIIKKYLGTSRYFEDATSL